MGVNYCGFGNATHAATVCTCAAKLEATRGIKVGRQWLTWQDAIAVCLSPELLVNPFSGQSYPIQVYENDQIRYDHVRVVAKR